MNSVELEPIIQRARIDRSLSQTTMLLIVSGVVSMILSMVMGLISTIKIHSPDFLTGCGCMDVGRLFAAQQNLMVYGCALPLAMAIIVWVTARVTGKEGAFTGASLVATLVWNFTVGLGTVAILFGYGTGVSWMEYPRFAWLVLFLAYSVIVVGPLVQLKVSRRDGEEPTGLWYVLAGTIFFAWLFLTANIMIHWLTLHPLMAAVVNVWYKSGVQYAFLLPVGLGVVSLLTPMITGKPLYSQTVARVGIGSLIVIAPWAGIQKLTGAPIPVILPYLSGAAAAMIFIPSLLGSVNVLVPMWQSRDKVATCPTLRFMVIGLAMLMVLTLEGAFFHLPNSLLKGNQFSIASYSRELLGLYGFFGCVAIGFIYYVVPRLTKREWLSSCMIRCHYLGTLYAMVTIAVVTVVAALDHGSALENFKIPFTEVAMDAVSYAYALSFAWVLLLGGQLCFIPQLLLLWIRLGRRSAQATPFCPVSSQPEAAKVP